MHPAIPITIVCVVIILWSILGALWVLFLDLFGGRYDYDKDYPLTAWQMFKAGPIVWITEMVMRKK